MTRFNTVSGRKAGIEIERGKITYHGLCRACESNSYCTFPRDPARSVLQCDEFRGISAERPLTEKDLGIAPLKPSAEYQQPAPTRFKGLCVNCDSRDTCTFAKPEGGVWRCEEYK